MFLVWYETGDGGGSAASSTPLSGPSIWRKRKELSSGNIWRQRQGSLKAIGMNKALGHNAAANRRRHHQGHALLDGISERSIRV